MDSGGRANRGDEASAYLPDLGIPPDEALNHGFDDQPISFRRFLAPAGQPAAAGRPDVAAGLPDFVQDDTNPPAPAQPTPPSAAAAPSSVAPDSGRRAALSSPSVPSTAGGLGARRKVRVAQSHRTSAISPSGSGSITATPISPAVAVGAHAPHGLPDFLSDGPMGTLRHAATDDGGASRGGSSNYPPQVSPPTGAAGRIVELERENAAIRQALSQLQRQLEAEIHRSGALERRLRQEPHSSLHISSTDATATSSTGASASPAAAASCSEDEFLQLREEVQRLRLENVLHQQQRRRSDLDACRGSNGGGGGKGDADTGAELRTDLQRQLRMERQQRAASERLVLAASAAEQLISQLLAGVHNLRSIASSLEGDQSVNSDLDEPQGASGPS